MKKSLLLSAACACVISFISLSSFAAGVPGQGTWETTLEARDFDGNTNTIEGYYDTVQGITWLADADAMALGFWVEWAPASAWAAGLDFGTGIDNWRLPYTVDVGNDGASYTNLYQGVDYGYNITTHSELSHMYYVTLGNTSQYDTSGNDLGCGWPGTCLSNSGPFRNIVEDGSYWSATEYAPDNDHVWAFAVTAGLQWTRQKWDWDCCYAWAVHDGDVGDAIIPIPAAVWLFGSGLLGLVGIARRRSNTSLPIKRQQHLSRSHSPLRGLFHRNSGMH